VQCRTSSHKPAPDMKRHIVYATSFKQVRTSELTSPLRCGMLYGHLGVLGSFAIENRTYETTFLLYVALVWPLGLLWLIAKLQPDRASGLANARNVNSSASRVNLSEVISHSMPANPQMPQSTPMPSSPPTRRQLIDSYPLLAKFSLLTPA
jgi:hypothetical protein